MTAKSDLDPNKWRDLMAFACIGVSYKYSTRDVHSLNQLVVFVREMMSAQQFLSKAKEKKGRYELINEVISELVSSCYSRENMLTDNIEVSAALSRL